MKSFTEITLEEAKKQGYIPLEEDYLNSSINDTRYYSLSPHPDPEKSKLGWEKVTYYLARKRTTLDISSEGTEFVYVLSNPSLPGLLKIGYTSKDPNTRVKEISKSTGIPVPFRIEFLKRCVNGEQLEKAVHKYLQEYRVNNRKEFFEVKLKTVKEVIESIHKQIFS